MYFVYVLESVKDGRYYVGATGDLEDRLKRHNSGQSKSTRLHVPYIIMYTESFSTLSEARRRELEIKKRKSRSYIERLIRSKQ